MLLAVHHEIISITMFVYKENFNLTCISFICNNAKVPMIFVIVVPIIFVGVVPMILLL